ncbi:hypothetical protein MLD38_005184 [Melastoma candidum]|uniref:Uncharacterized protein n=1 Tax=Melastoma candidum TaxID=119954 RepID=A0ACB9S7K3_9MYRT|nr:hypothetical protein MLD38_005184 [Melastoma candidum]
MIDSRAPCPDDMETKTNADGGGGEMKENEQLQRALKTLKDADRRVRNVEPSIHELHRKMSSLFKELEQMRCLVRAMVDKKATPQPPSSGKPQFDHGIEEEDLFK